MQCGAKCFLVTMTIDGKEKSEYVTARTPISARKTIRRVYGNQAHVLKVVKKKKKYA